MLDTLPTGPEFWWTWWIRLLGTIGTLAAVAVALFGQVFKGKFFPPQLTLKILNNKGEEARARMHPEGTDYPCRYYHVRVSNDRPWSPADQLQVVLLQVEQPGVDGKLVTVWTGCIPFGWRHSSLHAAARKIGSSPGDADLCSVTKFDKKNVLQIHLMVAPYNFNVSRTEAVKFVFSVQAQAVEGNSPVERVSVSWDGNWHDGADEMLKHLRVEMFHGRAVHG